MQSRVRFNRVPEKVPEKEGEFNRVPEKGPEKVWDALVSQVQPGSHEGCREGFGAKPRQVQQGCEEGSTEGSRRLWCIASSGVQSQVRFNRVPEKVPEKVPENV